MPERPVFDRFWGFSMGLPGRHAKIEIKNLKKGRKSQKIKKFNIIFYRCRNAFYEVYTWFGHVFRFFDPFFFYFEISAHFTSAEFTGPKTWFLDFLRVFRRWDMTVKVILNSHSISTPTTWQNTSKGNIWCPTDLFMTVFEAFQRAFRTDMTDLCTENMQKRVIFLNFRFFLDIEKRLWRWLWTHIRFPHRRHGKIQAIDNIWCPKDLFLTVFEASRWASRADMQKSK